MGKAELIAKAQATTTAIKAVHPDYEEAVVEIENLYETILGKSEGDAIHGIDCFPFVEMIKNSPLNNTDRRSVNLLKLQKCINLLAGEWDEWVKNNREEEFPEPKHLFFLTYLREHSHKAFYVKTFNSYMSPDERLVAITIPNYRLKLNYIPILHEMGHVIGCRKRKERKKDIFKFLLFSILREIFSEKMAEFDEVTSGNPYEVPKLKKPEEMDYYEAKWWAYAKCIGADLKNLHDALTKAIEPSIEKETGIKSYAMTFISTTCDRIVKELNQSETWTCVSEENRTDLQEAFLAVADRESAPFKTVSDIVTDIFEEPAADCFMVKIHKLKPNEYLNMIISEAYYTWKQTKKNKTNESFRQYMSSDILCCRILSVCYAMIEEKAAAAADKVEEPEERERVAEKVREKTLLKYDAEEKLITTIRNLNSIINIFINLKIITIKC